MKRSMILILLLCGISIVFAQIPKSTNYKKKNDFMVAVLNNPTFSLFNLISIGGLHERNTQFLDESSYVKSNFIINKCKELQGQYNAQIFHAIYQKVSASWKVFIEVQNSDLSHNGMGKYFMKYDMFDTSAPRHCPYPELKHKLSIVPLRLEEY